MYDNLVKEMHLFRRKSLSFATNIARSIAETRGDRLRAVTAGDAERAAGGARSHRRRLQPLSQHGSTAAPTPDDDRHRAPPQRDHPTMTNPLYDALFCPARRLGQGVLHLPDGNGRLS